MLAQNLGYKAGDIVKADVIKIMDYGIIVKTKDDTHGLIHISEIANEYVEVPEEYFYFGEEVEAKILKVEEDGRLSLSTRINGGKKKITAIGREQKTETEQSNIIPLKPDLDSHPDREKDAMAKFIKQYAEFVSVKAMEDIDAMIRDNGIFETTLALVEAVRDLDVSSVITSAAKSRLERGLLRQS